MILKIPNFQGYSLRLFGGLSPRIVCLSLLNDKGIKIEYDVSESIRFWAATYTHDRCNGKQNLEAVIPDIKKCTSTKLIEERRSED